MKNLSAALNSGTQATQRKKRATFYAICATVALLAILLIVLVVVLIAGGTAKSEEPTDDIEQTVSIGQTVTVNLGDSELYSGNLLLLDGTHTYNGNPNVESFQTCETRPKNETGDNSYTVGNINFGGTPETIEAFNKMMEAFYAKVKDDNIIIYDAYVIGSGSDIPAFSAGTAVELRYFSAADTADWSKKDDITGVDKYKWIYANAAKYGFVNVAVDGETSNIFRYVGVEHATAIASKKLTLNTYVEWLKLNTSPEKPLASKSGTTPYAIYYLSAAGEHLVPANYDYTVSGNNVDGYIVSVALSSSQEK